MVGRLWCGCWRIHHVTHSQGAHNLSRHGWWSRLPYTFGTGQMITVQSFLECVFLEAGLFLLSDLHHAHGYSIFQIRLHTQLPSGAVWSTGRSTRQGHCVIHLEAGAESSLCKQKLIVMSILRSLVYQSRCLSTYSAKNFQPSVLHRHCL